MYHRNSNMADFQSQYQEATSTIDGLVNTQLSQVPKWTNVPGSLLKASSSAGGYAWGYNSDNKLYRCQLPCSGNWEYISLSQYSLQGIYDLTTDTTNVYVLAKGNDGSTYLLSMSASATGGWIQVKIPFEANFIFSTHTYIWAQDSQNQKQKCAKPCTTGAWVPVPDKSGVRITSASDTNLYGVDSNGNGVKTDETIQTGWSSISGISGLKLSSLIGEMDGTALYGVDSKSNIFRCEGDCSKQDIENVDVAGYVPLNISPDSGGKDLWLTTRTTGNTGNVFNKLDKLDYSSLMNKITSLETQRDAIVKDTSKEYKMQTNIMAANKQVSDFVSYFKKFFQYGKDTSKKLKGNIGHLEEEIQLTQMQLDQINNTQPLIQVLLVTLIIVMLLYLFGSFLGSFVHILAFLTLIGGIVFAIYFSQTSNNGFPFTSFM